jgi:hypothetical protein
VWWLCLAGIAYLFLFLHILHQIQGASPQDEKVDRCAA